VMMVSVLRKWKTSAELCAFDISQSHHWEWGRGFINFEAMQLHVIWLNRHYRKTWSHVLIVWWCDGSSIQKETQSRDSLYFSAQMIAWIWFSHSQSVSW
jgi:hypothetical protein